jgi:ferredoxin
MTDEVYRKLAQVLDTLPNGFPATESGVEIKLLEKTFEPEEAMLFTKMRLSYETAAQIAARNGLAEDGLEEKLARMWRRGLVMGVDFGTVKLFRMIPWIFGIYEFQLNRMDREFAELMEEYSPAFSQVMMGHKPQLMQVLPIEKEIPSGQEALPYQRVSAIIEKGQSFAVADCICKKERGLLDHPCRHPLEVCLGIAPLPGFFDQHHWGRPISREEALTLLRQAEESGLVHLTNNVQRDHFFICNCCGCCCGVLRCINEMGMTEVVNSRYYAQIDEDYCNACGICKNERCPIGAISAGTESYRVEKNRCIGCGLCVSTCPSEAVSLISKEPAELRNPPKNEKVWFKERAQERGVDFSAYE